MRLARDLRELALDALGGPVGVRVGRPIVEADGPVTFLAHPYGIGDGPPRCMPPYAQVRVDPRRGEVLAVRHLAPDDPVRSLFPAGFVQLGETVRATASKEERHRAARLVDELQPLAFQRFLSRNEAIASDEVRLRAYAAAFWSSLWTYELPAQEELGGEFLKWLRHAETK